MQKELWLFPIGALALLTFFVLIQVPIRRFYAGFKGMVTAKDFKYGESKRVPDWVVVVNRNYMNLLEVPVLFYLICLIHFLTDRTDALSLSLAWIYVVTRIVHSTIHLTYNHVFHRLGVFAFSNLILGGLWLDFFRYYI
ncbi:hypothetical protein EHQ53_11005 [Leptospira langatensis]|uniref:MAPEG family protein n=1 Tax=Leptospira langatensis TaxID=2484983 RepID=A0A5F1ZUB2_9LEPT|nr:MAPEG family protein [Leptospira langatensis]TGJ98920.1 hypothetical protein EHO57_15495 [Leptospira langatensis]TGL40513.1 hypothetical protein EHQ53_11005 [Leptospira langatensis]